MYIERAHGCPGGGSGRPLGGGPGPKCEGQTLPEPSWEFDFRSGILTKGGRLSCARGTWAGPNPLCDRLGAILRSSCGLESLLDPSSAPLGTISGGSWGHFRLCCGQFSVPGCHFRCLVLSFLVEVRLSHFDFRFVHFRFSRCPCCTWARALRNARCAIE